MRGTSSVQTLLEVAGVHASYGAVTALRGVTLTALPGELITIVGANGAGKSTLLKVIAGACRADEGGVFFRGENIGTVDCSQRVMHGIALVPEGRRIFPRLTVQENLRVGAYTRRSKQIIREEMERMFELFPILKDRASQLGGTLSGGEQQMLALARALMSNPQLLLLDEPSMGIAPLIVAKIFEKIEELNKKGLTILLVEQNARIALKHADRAYVLEQGCVVMEGQAKDLLHDDRIRASYLGDN